MNNKDYTNLFGTMETKRVLKADYPTESSSLGVPIPIRKNGDLNSLQDYGFELFDSNNDLIQDPMVVNNTDQNFFTTNDTGWIGRSDEMSFIKMDEDIFQVKRIILIFFKKINNTAYFVHIIWFKHKELLNFEVLFFFYFC